MVDRRNAWGEDRVYFHDDKGKLRRLPATWTSVASTSPFEVMSAGRSHFRIEDLLRLVALVARQREFLEAARRVAGKRKVSRK